MYTNFNKQAYVTDNYQKLFVKTINPVRTIKNRDIGRLFNKSFKDNKECYQIYNFTDVEVTGFVRKQKKFIVLNGNRVMKKSNRCMFVENFYIYDWR